METQQPLLALCSSHWKAAHVLGNTLQASIRADVAGDLEEDVQHQTGTTKKRQQPASSPRQAKKMKREVKADDENLPTEEGVSGPVDSMPSALAKLSNSLQVCC